MTPEEIKIKDKDIHAFLEVFDDAKSEGDGPLSGKTIAIKDNIMFAEHKVSAGSKILENFIAPYDATVIRKLKEAGALIVGRTNCDEFAMGSSTENSAYGVTRNPYDLERIAGGSSGGSAAVVAAGMVDMALGSDTGGSIRQPAALCGVVGLKPTYGRVSRSGLIAMSSSFDQIGPFAKTVSLVETLYNVIKGQDPMDSTTISDGTYPTIKKFSKTIGIPKNFVESEGVSVEVRKNFAEAVERFRLLGYEIKEIDLPNLKYSLPVYYIIMPAEVSSNLARFDGVKYGMHKDGENGIDDYFQTRGAGFGQEVRRRIILGTYVLSTGYYDEYYGKAVEARHLITKELRELFEKVDIMLTPTTPSPAWKVGEKSNDPLGMYLEDIFTVHANISGCPAISLPSGFVGDSSGNTTSLPLGIELTADLGREDNLFVAGKDFLNETH
ncbi:MAG: Asp-tRNA(Asn)/Glu-tRNA(Gln) amidotransferase subunit GatA [Candidatus Zambryskibacteria bacterium]|nr:Asp-tRNA(Asn)/Glu-tRNA(Gln) amidotransferase subunit GatA [Candidatus Zambryskibacteria bacterium]